MTVQSSPSTFADRHIGARRQADIDTMLKAVGYDSVDGLVDVAVPDSIRQAKPLALKDALSEVEVLAELRRLAGKNKTAVQMIGQGYYDTVTPAVIRRNILEAPAWYTAYTPYQPEISQGRLEALLNFQTMVQDLVGLPIANASLLDEATAVAEAVLMMRRANKNKAAHDGKTVLDADVPAADHRHRQGPRRGPRLRGRGRRPVQGPARGRHQRHRPAAARRLRPRLRPRRGHRGGQGTRRAGHGRR